MADHLAGARSRCWRTSSACSGCPWWCSRSRLWKLDPDWGTLLHQIAVPDKPGKEGLLPYFYYAIALFGAAMTPYEVFFFSSGGVEEGWTDKDIVT